MASTLEIPFSQTKATSLCCYKVFLFIPTVTTRKYGCNLDLKKKFKNHMFDAPPSSIINSTTNPNVKTTEG
jgi:hypothetical protein